MREVEIQAPVPDPAVSEIDLDDRIVLSKELELAYLRGLPTLRTLGGDELKYQSKRVALWILEGGNVLVEKVTCDGWIVHNEYRPVR